jgi:lon-related putative ATP-dependent protease
MAAPFQESLRGGLQRYTVNTLVSHDDTNGAPVVYEDRPSLRQLMGRSENRIENGVLVTDFRLLRAGALHRANGGYLMLDARRVLQQPFAWEALKRTLRAGEIRIQSPYEEIGLVSTVSLDPEPIPLDVKVVLVGDRWLYYVLQALDPEFDELFRIEADFEDEIDRTDESERRYAQLLRRLAERADLRPLQPEALARLIEHSARLASKASKLSMEIDLMREIAREADFWAGEDGRDAITGGDIKRALDARRQRAGRLRERTQERILDETLFIDTTGTAVGQVNGLSVLQIGRDTFGRPTRITARVQLGTGKVVDIEREVELGGPIHSKGVMILSGFLGARYATEDPLSLTATLVFEQSYSGVEGDSASSAELYALLSAIGEVPLRQSLAVTGSVNQHGKVQPIGGVNEKIEGYFDICQARGLTGEQGVLIPQANVKDLMLRAEVREAVQNGQFHVYPIETVDQGMERLTGLEMGERQDDGTYPAGSINERVAHRLEQFAEERAEFQMSHDGQDQSVT